MDIAIKGAPAHTRTLRVSLLRAASGGVAARAEIIDLRKRGLIPMATSWQTAGIIHHMRVNARLDSELRISAIRAEQPHVAVEATERSRGECCRDPVRRIEALDGTRLDEAFTKRLGAAIGGPRGCSHILTLSQLVGSTTETGLAEEASRFPEANRPDGECFFERNLTIDGFETHDGALELAAQLADVHLAPNAEIGPLGSGLGSHREVRLEARIPLEGMAIETIRAFERTTTANTPGEWAPVDVAFLLGKPALAGMAKNIFATYGAGAEVRPIRDLLLNLAPTVIQCFPALTSTAERWRSSERSHPSGASPMPGGGMVDSCYIWRRDGGLHQSLTAHAAEKAEAEGNG